MGPASCASATNWHRRSTPSRAADASSCSVTYLPLAPHPNVVALPRACMLDGSCSTHAALALCDASRKNGSVSGSPASCGRTSPTSTA